MKIKYDLTAIKNVSRGNNELFNNMIMLFIQNTSNELQNLEKNISDKNIENTQTTIHKLKPSLAYLGLTPLIEELNNLKNYMINNNNDLTDKLFNKIKTNLNDIFDNLKNEII